MAVDSKYITVLADGIRSYYGEDELYQLCEEFGIELLYETATNTPSYMRLARSVISKLEHGNNRRFLETIVNSLVSRARRCGADRLGAT